MPYREHNLELTQPVGRILRRVLAQAKAYRLTIAGAIAMGLCGAGLTFVQPYIEGEGINKILEGFERGFLDWATWRPLLRLAGVLAAAHFTRLVLGYGGSMLMAHLRMQIVTDLRRRIYRKLLTQSFSFYDRQDSGLLINRAIGDVAHVQDFYSAILVRGTETLFSLAFFVLFLVYMDRWVALIGLPFLPLYVAAMVIFSGRLHPMFHDMRHELDRATEILSENVQGIQVVRAFGREPEEISRYERAVQAIYERWLRLAGAFAIYQPTILFTGEMLMLAMMAGSAWRVLAGGLRAGFIYTVYRWARMLTGHMRVIAHLTSSFQHSLVSAERIFEILDVTPDIAAPGQPKPLPPGGGHVVFDRVSFGYGPDQPILRDVCLDIPAGTNVALVGPTGSGKSTLIKLLARFYEPQQGRILIDGADLKDVGLEALRSEIGFVFQDTFLFSTSLAENIAFGVPEAEQRAIEEVARRAGVDEFAARLENGYDTSVGERGQGLSGGQRQRVAIARALLVDPRILILDDATASVDASTERAIQDNLAAVMKGRTTFIVAHRASTVKRAGLVLVLEGGRVVQRGTHADLVAAEGPYREFCRMQWQLGLDEEEAVP
jgi:ATP-binding cassette subfamily B protein